MDGLWARGENETPNPKHQAPEKSQTSNSKTGRRLAALELGTWSFFGVWSLEFGALIGGRISPLPDPLPTSPSWGEGIDRGPGGSIKQTQSLGRRKKEVTGPCQALGSMCRCSFPAEVKIDASMVPIKPVIKHGSFGER